MAVAAVENNGDLSTGGPERAGPPAIPGSPLLERHLGPIGAAEERCRIRARQRETELRYRAAGLALDSAERNRTSARRLARLEAELARSRAELRRLRAAIPELVQEEVRRLLAEELPEAVTYLMGQVPGVCNGRA